MLISKLDLTISLIKIRNYLIRLNNDHRAMREIKKKKLIKIKSIKQVIFVKDFFKSYY